MKKTYGGEGSVSVSADELKGMMCDLEKTKNKKFDVSLLSDDDSPCVVTEWMSTGCLALDTIMGGGLPIGRMTEIYGDNSTGKSLIASQVAAIAQEDGAIVVYADTESAVSLPMMQEVGVDISKLIYSAPDTVEEVFELFSSAIESKAKRFPDKRMLLIWDSVAATSVEQEMENPYGKATMGRHAQIISQSMRKFTRIIAKEHVCCLFLNQTREKIGVMFGDNVATFGGKAIGFHASIRIQLKMGQKIKNGAGKRTVGINSRATIVKNKVAVPFKMAELPIYFGHGIDDALASFEYLRVGDLLNRKGSYYTVKGLSETESFTKNSWEDYYDKHYEEIADIISKTDLIDEDSEEEDSEDENES